MIAETNLPIKPGKRVERQTVVIEVPLLKHALEARQFRGKRTVQKPLVRYDWIALLAAGTRFISEKFVEEGSTNSQICSVLFISFYTLEESLQRICGAQGLEYSIPDEAYGNLFTTRSVHFLGLHIVFCWDY